MDLHSGLPWWVAKNPLFDYVNPLRGDHETDVAVIGSGITGALVAHELCRAGLNCCVLDKRTPSTGSSIASTALLQYEIDTPLCKLAEQRGEEQAVTAYRGCLQSITDVERVLEQTGTKADFRTVPNLFYASALLDASLIRQEYAIREKHGLPVDYLDRKGVREQWGVKAPCGLTNRVSAQMDPYAAATGILHHHLERRELDLFTQAEVQHWEENPDGYLLSTSRGDQVRCRHVVIAAGFEAGPFLPREVMKLTSTYALVSEPVDPALLWPGEGLIWESAQPYLYIRTTANHRIIVGGEDEAFRNPVARDRLLRKKIAKLERRMRKLFPSIPFKTDTAWCGTFSSTEDGLPFIGTWPGRDRMHFALGYGGNGITFSMIAAQMIANRLRGVADERDRVFGFERLLNE